MMDFLTSTTQNMDIYDADGDTNYAAPKVASYNALDSHPNQTNNTDVKEFRHVQSDLEWREFNRYWDNSDEAQAADYILLYVSPILVVFGTVGNLLSYCALKHRLMKQSSVYYYMALYALANTLCLNMSCGLEWVTHITSTNHIANRADWICRLWHFIINVVRYGPTWLVVLMVFDRFIYLCIPSKAHSICTVFTAKVFSCFAAVILVAVSIHAMWTYEIVNMEIGCSIDENRHDFQTEVWPVIAATFHIYMPMILVLIFDFLIVLNTLILSARQYLSRNFSPLQQQLSVAVLAVSVSFLLLTLPQVITNLIDHINPHMHNTYRSLARLYFTDFVCRFLIFLLYSINFPLYFITLPPLRKEIVVWFHFVIKKKTRQVEERFTIECNGQLLNQEREDSKAQIMTQL